MRFSERFCRCHDRDDKNIADDYDRREKDANNSNEYHNSMVAREYPIIVKGRVSRTSRVKSTLSEIDSHCHVVGI